MNNLKNMLSKSSPSIGTTNPQNTQYDEAFKHLSIDDFFADVMKAANERASDINADTGSMNWETDVHTFRLGASFALQWFSDKILQNC